MSTRKFTNFLISKLIIRHNNQHSVFLTEIDTDSFNRTESRINSKIYNQLIFDKGPGYFVRERKVFSTTGFGYPHGKKIKNNNLKNAVGPLSELCRKINSKFI